MRHLLGTPCERERHGRQQRLGHEGHGHADGEHQPVRCGSTGDHHDDEEGGTDGHGDQRNGAHDPSQGDRERARRRIGRCRQRGDVRQPRPAARCRDEREGLALHDEGPGGDVVALRRPHGFALPGQQGRVHQQPVRDEHRPVRRDAVPAFEGQHVADDHLGAVDLLPAPVAHHRDLHGQERPEACRRLPGPALLEEGEHRVEHDHQRDGCAELGDAGHERQRRCHPQHQCEEVHQLRDQPAHGRALDRWREGVGAVSSEAGGRGCGGEPDRR